jgi:hypothetical protein
MKDAEGAIQTITVESRDAFPTPDQIMDAQLARTILKLTLIFSAPSGAENLFSAGRKGHALSGPRHPAYRVKICTG